jgi:D-sedoheptulose 7-phosphate isomerase
MQVDPFGSDAGFYDPRAMLEQRIQQQFYESADLKVRTADALAKPIADAAVAVLGAITSGGKVLALGVGASFADAQALVAAFVGRYERERPPLAAVALGADAGVMQGLIADDGEVSSVAIKQVQALGAPGDVLLLVAARVADTLANVVQAAHDKDMTVVAITGRSTETLAMALGETDVHVSVSHDRVARIREVHMLALNCLCDAVDLQLMGEQEFE